MDLDLGQVRAFVAAADQQHITRAAGVLHLSQQALSKRLARLEDTVGLLLVRGPTGVSLTERGQHFLPFARDLLALADTATAAARAVPLPALRVDVWGHLHPVLPLVRGFAHERPDVTVQISMRRNLPQALDALVQRQLDVAFGYLPGLPGPLPVDLAATPVTCTRLVALVSDAGRHTHAELLTPPALAECSLWFPGQGSSPELTAYAGEYARHVHAELSTDGANLGLEALLQRLSAAPDTVTLVGDDWPVHDLPGLRVVPVRTRPALPLVGPLARQQPAPCYRPGSSPRCDGPATDPNRLPVSGCPPPIGNTVAGGSGGPGLSTRALSPPARTVHVLHRRTRPGLHARGMSRPVGRYSTRSTRPSRVR